MSHNPAPSSSSSFPLSATPMVSDDHHHHPFSPLSLHQHLSRLTADLFSRFHDTRRVLFDNASNFLRPRPSPLLASTSASALQPGEKWGNHSFDIALGADYIAKTMVGTTVYTVSNSNNEFVLISDPNNSVKTLGLLCFRQEDAQALLAQVALMISSFALPLESDSVLLFGFFQVQLKQPVLGKGAKVVPITLEQVYMLKVEGIAFRFLPDPLQIKHALELKSANIANGFDGVPVFQSDLLVVKKKNRRYCPIYFQKEDIERDLMKVSRKSRGSGSAQNIMVGGLEDVLKKMEMNDKNTGWEDLIFIPPGKSYSQQIGEVAA